ncbi:hypothetical protein [Brevibacillus sp. SYSU BS000544]|uniref:hypothetical protein n=1 Tax=Brevibacillus sp. SYSU BS000544 TaxID=3416443 RepID=UPI003CE5BA46
MKTKVIYGYHNGNQVPIWLVVNFESDELDRTKKTLYIQIEAPFQQLNLEDMHPDSIGLTVALSDLVLNREKPGEIGILTSELRQRTDAVGVDFQDIRQLMIQIADIEEMFFTRI